MEQSEIKAANSKKPRRKTRNMFQDLKGRWWLDYYTPKVSAGVSFAVRSMTLSPISQKSRSPKSAIHSSILTVRQGSKNTLKNIWTRLAFTSKATTASVG